jgi:hypothetical protein
MGRVAGSLAGGERPRYGSGVSRLSRWFVGLFVASCAPAGGVSPLSGSSGGGEPLRISGDGFAAHGAPVVYVCERPARGVVVESDRLIRVLTPPAEAAGACEVRVEFADGVAITAGTFVYVGVAPAEPFNVGEAKPAAGS